MEKTERKFLLRWITEDLGIPDIQKNLCAYSCWLVSREGQCTLWWTDQQVWRRSNLPYRLTKASLELWAALNAYSSVYAIPRRKWRIETVWSGKSDCVRILLFFFSHSFAPEQSNCFVSKLLRYALVFWGCITLSLRLELADPNTAIVCNLLLYCRTSPYIVQVKAECCISSTSVAI